MENKVIAKTLLTMWPDMDDYANMLGSRAQTHALCSYHTPMLTERIMEKIISLNVKRHTIRNLKQKLDQAINGLRPELQQVLRCHFRGCAATERVPNLAKAIGMSERSYFRRLNTALETLARRLPELGINFFTWHNLLKNHPWVRETFTRELQLSRRQTSGRRKE